MKVKFNQSVTTETRKEDQESFEAGKVYDLSDASANHWVSRGKAARVEDAAREPREPARPEPPAGGAKR